jgi:regulator of protease activity HflC (stomatin/prohibitin superfamily)
VQGAVVVLVFLAVLVAFTVIVVAKSVALIPQAEAAVIERLGRYSRTVSGQLTLLVPFIDRVRARVDLRERVVSFPPQPVITEDNLTLNIDTVVYFQVTVPQAAVYEISNYIVGVEQLTTTTLRNVVGGMTLEQTLTSRDKINGQLRGVLDEATGRWGDGKTDEGRPGEAGHDLDRRRYARVGDQRSRGPEAGADPGR